MVNPRNFPKTLKEFGYGFNKLGQLRELASATGELTDKPFEFNVLPTKEENQLRYEALGDAITDYVYKLLELEGLIRLPLPKNCVEPNRGSFVFASTDWATNEKILLLVHGSGVVRAGQWARSLIINDCLDSGTQLPFIKAGLENGWAVLVANTNDNERDGIAIEGSASSEQHLQTLWQDYVLPNRDSKVAIVAHSYGGMATFQLAAENEDTFQKKTIALALTDSVHSFSDTELSNSLKNHLNQIGHHWVASSQPLDTPIKNTTHKDPITAASAGHTIHAATSWSSFKSIFKFLEDKFSGVYAKKSAN